MLFNLTVSELKVCISSLQPKSAKYFLSILSQNQTSLQVSDDYFSMIVSTLLSVIVTSEPLLFYDVVPFLHYLEPDELIGLLPPLQDDKEVLQVLSHYAGSLSETQRLALGFWLRRSTLFQNLTRMDDTFILRVGNLLPLFSLDVFLQLSTQQVVNILPSLPWDLTPPYQRIVASKVLQAPNITVQDVELMGRCVCQADVQDLKPYGQNMDISLALRRNLFECVRRGDFFPDSMMLEFLFGDLQFQDIRNFSLESVPKLSVVIRSLGYNFLQGLRPEQLLPVLSDVASVTLTSAQARELVQKVLNPGNVSDEVLSHLGSLVLGISPTILQTLSTNQLVKLLPGLTSNADMLSSAQIMAVFRTMWASGNVSLKLMELGPLLPSLPLIMLRTRSKEVLSSLSNLRPMAGVKWSQQQALLLIREATQMSRISDGVRSSANSVTGTNCDSLRSLLQDNTIQAIEKFRDVINSLPQHVVRCALDKVIPLPPSLTLLKSLSSQMIAEIQTSAVSLLPAKSCRHVLNILKSEAQSVAALPQQRRFVLLDALISCLNSAGTTSTQAQFIVLGVLTPFVRGSAFLTLSQGMMLQNVERVTNYCYPQETQLPLSQLLQETQGFGSTARWTSQLLKRLDRLVPLLPLASLKSLNMAAISSRWLFQMLFEERKWRKSALGTACRKTQTVEQQAENMQKQRIVFQRLFLSRSMPRSSAVLAPECGIVRGSIVSAWGVDVLMRMTSVNFMDCLEEIGLDPDIPNSELIPLLDRVLKIAGPVSVLPNNVLIRLGRLATKLMVQQLKAVSLGDLQVMEAFGRQQEWTISQLNTLVNGFMQSHNVTAKDLNTLHLVTLGYVICGLPEKDMEQMKPLEFCSAVMYLGHLALSCTEQQLEALARLCNGNDIFGPVSGWTEDIFLEIGSVAAGLQDIELSSLVLEQIQGLTPLAISLIHPKKFAVSFSSQQLQLFSWSQAKAVTEQQRKLLDIEQMRALTLALIEDSGNQTYRAGKSHADHCSYHTLLHLSTLLPVLYVLYIVQPTVVLSLVNRKQ
ncbi:stereocilin-like isoform X5 [Rhinoderma darwinii]